MKFVLRLFTTVTSLLVVGAALSAAPAASSTASVWHRPILSIGANQSSNWSGYNQGSMEQGNKLFNQVSGHWKVPTATQHKANEAEYSSTWVGIGGGCVDAQCQVTDGTLIQAGTEQDVDTSGKASYSAWYELIPAPSIQITKLKVSAGDKMSVDITENPANSNVWTITVKNLTSGKKFKLTTPYSSTHLTAEWIVETPVVIDSGGNVTIGPLPDLSRVQISKTMTNAAGANIQASEEIQLVDPNTNEVLATPSDPNPTNSAFNDCTYATNCKAPK